MSDSGSDFATGGAAPATPLGRPSRTRRINVPTLASRAALCCYLVVDSTLPCPAALQAKWAKTVDREPHFDGDMLAIVGVIYSSWFFRTNHDAISDDDTLTLTNAALKTKRRANVMGFVDYIVDFIYMFSEDVHLPEASALNNGIDFAVYHNKSLRSSVLCNLTMDDVVEHHNNIKPSNAMVVSANLGELLAKNETSILRVVPLAQRIDMQYVIDGFPTKKGN